MLPWVTVGHAWTLTYPLHPCTVTAQRIGMWSGSFLYHLHCHGAWHGVSDSRTILELHEGPLRIQIRDQSLVRWGNQPEVSPVSPELTLHFSFIQHLFTGPLTPALSPPEAPPPSPAHFSPATIPSVPWA